MLAGAVLEKLQQVSEYRFLAVLHDALRGNHERVLIKDELLQVLKLAE